MIEQTIWEVFLKVMFPIIWTGLSPIITTFIARGIGGLRSEVKVVISTVLGAVIAGVAGAIPDFPLTIESAAIMGTACGGTGQILLNMNPTKSTEQAIKSGVKQGMKEGLQEGIQEVKDGIQEVKNDIQEEKVKKSIK